jgi:hypothetical protein
MSAVFFTLFVLVLVPAAAMWFGTDSRESKDPRRTQRSLLS